MERYFILILLYAGTNVIMSTNGEVCDFDSRCQCTTWSSWLYKIHCWLWKGTSPSLPKISGNYTAPGHSLRITISAGNEGTSVDAMFLSEVTLGSGNIQLSFNGGIDLIHCTAFSGQEYTLYYLYLSDNNLAEIPECALKGMKGLRTLSLSGNKIESINSHAFVTLTNLTYLYLDRNEIESIHCSAFVGLEYKLTRLDLYDNNLTEVPECALKRLIGLTELVLSDNKFVNISSLAFVTLKSMTLLRLARNRIDAIHCSAFVGLEKLDELDLSGNNLDQVPECAFTNLKNLHILKLAENKIIAIDSNSFYGLNLCELHLGGNNISSIDLFDFNHFPNLGRLDVSSNRLRVLNIKGNITGNRFGIMTLLASNNFLTAMPFLHFQIRWGTYFHIDFSKNKITTLPEKQLEFDHLDSSRRPSSPLRLILLLSDNSIKDIHVHPNFVKFNGTLDFGDPTKLYVMVNFVDNMIDNITFLRNTNLSVQYTRVNLENNNIVYVSEKDFKLITSGYTPWPLEKLFLLGGNPLRCDCDLFWMRNESYRSILLNFFSTSPTCASPPNMKDYLATCFPASCGETGFHSSTSCAKITTTTSSTSIATTSTYSGTVSQVTTYTQATENFTSTNFAIASISSSTETNCTKEATGNYTPIEFMIAASLKDSNSGSVILVSLLCISLVVHLLVTVFMCLLWRRSDISLRLSSIKSLILPGDHKMRNQHPTALNTITHGLESRAAYTVNENTSLNEASPGSVNQNEAVINTSGRGVTGEDLGQYMQLDPSTRESSELRVYDQMRDDQQLYENVKIR